ncbi:MAG: hypothetical protein ACXWKH_11130 [Limisphaerales bacterium]
MSRPDPTAAWQLGRVWRFGGPCNADTLKVVNNAAPDTISFIGRNIFSYTSIWLHLEVAFPPEALAFWSGWPSFSGDFAHTTTRDTGRSLIGPSLNNGFDPPRGLLWYNDSNWDGAGIVGPAPPEAETWHTLDVLQDGTVFTIIIDDETEFGGEADTHDGTDPVTPFDRIDIGQLNSNYTSESAIAYIRNVYAGSVYHSDDIFPADFATEGLDVWDVISGSVSLVNNPYP